MSSKIVSVGVSIPHESVEFCSLSSKQSLLDFDIAVFDPAIQVFYSQGDGEYNGKRSLTDSASFNLKEHLEHWRREVADALRAGKTIFVLLNGVTEVFAATGEKQYSGTGRSRASTRIVDIARNYSLVPAELSVTGATGSSMVLSGKESILTPYWPELMKYAKYRVLLQGKNLVPLVTTRTGNKVAGAYLRYQDGGTLVLLPYIDFTRDDFVDWPDEEDNTSADAASAGENEEEDDDEDDDEPQWTAEAVRLGANFVAALQGMDAHFREGAERTLPPDWAGARTYALAAEAAARGELLLLERRIAELEVAKEGQLSRLAESVSLRALLYEKGKPLENAIIKALGALGFVARPFKEGGSEFDVVFESADGRLVGEAEGKDNKAINIDKLRQLEMNLHEDFAREDVTQMAKGVLFGNAFRLQEPDKRGQFFTEKCITAAQRNSTALVKTTDLFQVSRYAIETNDDRFAAQCRAALLSAAGPVAFPAIPERTADAQADSTGMTTNKET